VCVCKQLAQSRYVTVK